MCRGFAQRMRLQIDLREERDLDAEQRVNRLREVLQQLPPKRHAAVVLQYWHGLSYEEIDPGATFTPASVTLNNPNVRAPEDGFFDDITRGYTQKAAYASVDFDLLPRTLTAGTRYFRTTTSEAGAVVSSLGHRGHSTARSARLPGQH